MRHALDRWEEITEADDNPWQKLYLLDTLGVAVLRQDRSADAEIFFRHALEGLEKIHGPDHFITMLTVSELCVATFRLDMFQKGKKSVNVLLKDGRKSPSLGYTYAIIAITPLPRTWPPLLLSKTSFEEAERLLLRALDGEEKMFGPNHPSTLETKKLIISITDEQASGKSVIMRLLCISLTLPYFL